MLPTEKIDALHNFSTMQACISRMRASFACSVEETEDFNVMQAALERLLPKCMKRCLPKETPKPEHLRVLHQPTTDLPTVFR